MSSAADGCIQFTRHAGDVLFNFNRLRSRTSSLTSPYGSGVKNFMHIRPSSWLAVGFYTIFVNAHKTEPTEVSLDPKADPDGFAILLDFMYTSCLTLKERFILATLNTAVYLQMDHMVETCHRFMESRGLIVKQPQEEPPMSANHLSKDMVRSFLDPAPPVVHYELSTSLGNPMSIYSRPTPRPFLLHAASNAKPLLWEVPKDNNDTTCGPCSSLEGSSGKRSMMDPAVHLEQSSKVEETEVENSPHIVNPRSPLKSDCQPNSPAESSGCSRESASSPKMRNWKKYKFIMLNSAEGDENSLRNSNWSMEKCSETARTPMPVSMSTHVVSQENNMHSLETKTEGSDLECSQWQRIENDTENHPCLHNTKPYNCDLLRTSFTSSQNLTSHKAVAPVGDKPYRCNVCGAQFNRPANLKTHLRIHSGEKPYKCETCGSAFVQVAHLRAHVLIHTGEKPYCCSVCNTRFRHLQTLKSHLRIHTGEKPYHCETCDLRFRHKSQLRLHLRQKHGAPSNMKTTNH